MDNTLFRDGVSQGQRKPKALDPDYVHVDERTLDDLLQFAQALSKEIKFFNTNNKNEGNWEGMFHDTSAGDASSQGFSDIIRATLSADNVDASVAGQATIDDNWRKKALEFIANPEKFGTDTSFSAPHRALFFTFLLLMDYVKQQTNQITKRHLDYLYRESLRLVLKKAIPDQVNLLVKLVNDADQLLIEKGTKLLAGKDALGKDLIYQTDQEIVLNKATIDQVKTIYVKHDMGIDGLKGIDAIKRVFGNPDKQYLLPKLPISIKLIDKADRLERLRAALDDNSKRIAAIDYIRESLFMTVNEFVSVMEADAKEVLKGEKAYNTLYKAWGQKRETYTSQTPLIIDDVFVTPNAREDIIRSEYDKFKDFDEWNTFGTREKLNGVAQNGFMGMAITSPVLKMGTGERHVILRLFIDKDGWNYIKKIEKEGMLPNEKPTNTAQSAPAVTEPYTKITDDLQALFMLNISVASGWEELTPEHIKVVGGEQGISKNHLEVKFMLPESFPAVETIDEDVVFAGVAKKNPALIVSLKNITIYYPKKEQDNSKKYDKEKVYQAFKYVKINKTDFDIDVTGIADFSIENEQGSIDPKKPFEPFGYEPIVGSSFYVAHPEICYKNISRLNLETEWLDKPDKLNDYYQCYYNDYEFVIQGEVSKCKVLNDRESGENYNLKIKKGTKGTITYLGIPPVDILVENEFTLVFKSTKSTLKLETSSSKACDFKFSDLDKKYSITCADHVNYEIEPNEKSKQQLSNFLKRTLSHTLKAVVSKDAKDNIVNAKAAIFGLDGNDQVIDCKVDNSNGVLDYSEDVKDSQLFNIGDRKCYYRFELTGDDFEHKRYPFLLSYYTQRAFYVEASKFQNAEDKINTEDVEAENPEVKSLPIFYQKYLELLGKPPYTPQLKKLTLGYSVYASSDECEHFSLNQILHFGYKPISLRSEGDPDSIISTKIIQDFDYQGELLLGIKDLRPPQNLSILFQLAEGSTDADLGVPLIEWNYLENNSWKSLHNGNILSDGTNGMVNSGIIKFKIPANANTDNTLLSNGLHWIRASVKAKTQAVCKMISIDTQAISATLVGEDSAPDHYKKPLPPMSISTSVDDIPQLDSISQPYSSFGQRPAEEDTVFYGRVSERLRHKNRAVSMWDYERLMLQHFPDVHKAKCLIVRDGAISSVKIVAIPEVKGKVPFNPFEPKFTRAKLENMKRFLENHASPYVQISVCNPIYKRVKVTVKVEFRNGLDQGYYGNQLNEDLKKFLSPWAFEGGVDIIMGRKIHKNILVNYIEELPYIDYIEELKLSEADAKETSEEDEILEADDSKMVLGSAPYHTVNDEDKSTYAEDTEDGIGSMVIGLDNATEKFRVF